ncbi:hypothetical protein EI94DRAFT_1724873 [Lactarius quietus]|nr:hypothetical protein EI94DRAFT_1724873 [Lactarius quietus]
MHFYTPSPLSMGYIPRVSYRPALVPTYLDDDFSSAFAFEEVGYPAFRHTSSPRLDAETRYRRALHELEAAEEEFEAHLVLKRSRQAAVLREQAARRERALAIQAEVERIECARALQAKLAEEYELHQRVHRAQAAAFDRARHQKHALRQAFVDANPSDPFAFERPCASSKKRLTHSSTRRPALHDDEAITLDDLLKLFSGSHSQGDGLLQQIRSRAPSQPRSAEPQPSEKQDVAEDAVKAVLEFIHDLATHGKDSANVPETISKPSAGPQSQAVPVDEKGKGKAKAEPSKPAQGPTFFQTLLAGLRQGQSDQELKDIELAIKLSLEDRDAADVKKASAAKAVRSSSGASSSRVKLDGAVPPSNTPSSGSDTTSVTAKPIPAPVTQPVSPLTTIRAVRNQLSTLESTFKFPAVIDFDQSVLAVSPNNAPLRTYENTLNGFLEQLDAIESDGDEEVRNTRREVVKEVEKALEDLERKVSEKAPKIQATKDVEVKGYDVEAEEVAAPAAEDTEPVESTSVAESAETAEPEPSGAVSQADVDIDLAISGEYLPPLPVVESSQLAVVEPGKNVVAQTVEGASPIDDDEITPALGDPSESVATITATPASGPSDTYVPASSEPETFLSSLSHDQFAFPPKPSYSDARASPAGSQDDDVLVDNSEEGGSVKSGEDGWSEVDA